MSAVRGALAGFAVLALIVVGGCGESPTADLPGADPAPAATDGAAAGPTSPDTSDGADPGPSAPRLPVTVTSADGRTVTVADVSRIIPLQGNLAEIVFDLGLGDNVVGRDISATFPEAADLPLVTRAHDVSAESVLSLRPTVVLADVDTGPPEALDHLRNVGVPVIVFDRPTAIDDIVPRIHTVAQALGVAGSGDDLAARTADELTRAAEDVPDESAPRVAFLYLRGAAGVYLIGGPGSGADSMIEAAGGIDAGTEMGLDDPFTPITSEALVEAAPEVVLLTTTGLQSVGGVDGLLDIAGIAQTPAGRDQRVVTIEDGLLFSFGARTPDAIDALVDQLHPVAGE